MEFEAVLMGFRSRVVNYAINERPLPDQDAPEIN